MANDQKRNEALLLQHTVALWLQSYQLTYWARHSNRKAWLQVVMNIKEVMTLLREVENITFSAWYLQAPWVICDENAFLGFNILQFYDDIYLSMTEIFIYWIICYISKLLYNCINRSINYVLSKLAIRWYNKLKKRKEK